MYFRFHKEISAALIILFLLVIFFYFIYKPLFLIFLILLIFTFYFFRDPERVVPLGDDILVSPADGLITNISEYKEGKKSYTKVSIFLSVFNVHIQRLPVSGQITKIDYIEGKFINATLDKASEENERNYIKIKDPSKYEKAIQDRNKKALKKFSDRYFERVLQAPKTSGKYFADAADDEVVRLQKSHLGDKLTQDVKTSKKKIKKNLLKHQVSLHSPCLS